MSRFQMQIATEFPILFLGDEGSTQTPESTGQQFVTVTSDCLCFFVLSYVDGASLITVTDQDCDMGGRKLFVGSIESASGVLTVSDSYNFRYLNVPVPPGLSSIEIWADDEQNPEWVWLKLGAIREY